MATTYYVSNSGNDTNTGLSEQSPWKTLKKINSSTFKPGDYILLKRGDTWRESITIPSSGNSTSRIVFSAYGTGNKPVILGSRQPVSWTNQGGNIWKSDASFTTNPYNVQGTGGGNIWSINTDLSVNTGIYQTSLGALTADNMWYYGSNSIYLYSTSNPSTRYRGVEVCVNSYGIGTNHKQYLEINGIDIFYATVGIYESTYPSAYDVKGLIIRNCELAYFGYPNGAGIGIYAFYSNSLMENNTIHDCGRRGISLITYTNNFTIRDVTIQNNTFYHGYHTTSVDLQGTSGYTGGCDNLIIRSNLIYDAPNYAPPAYPMQMFLSDQGAKNSMTNILVYNNIFKYASGASININGIESLNVYNNTFYGHNEVRNSLSSFLFITKTHATVKNNIFYSQLSYDNNDNGLAYLVGEGADFAIIKSDYNCYYRKTPTLVLIRCPEPYYRFMISNYPTLQSSFQWETHSKFSDPKIISSSDLNLQSTSPCKQAGINLGFPFTGSAPDIGASQTGLSSKSVLPVSNGIASGTYTLIARHSGKAIGIKGASTASGAIVEQETYTGAISQQFVITDMGTGYYQISPVNNTVNKLDVSGGSIADYATIIQYPSNGGTNQQWSFVNLGNGYYEIVSRNSGKCLDITSASTADGTIVQQYTYVSGANQQFALSRLKSALVSESIKDTIPDSHTASIGSEAVINSDISLYPNPSQNGIFNINLNSYLPEQNVQISIYSMNGQLVHNQKSQGNTIVEVNSELKTGIYVVKIHGGYTTITKKLVIE